MRCPICGGPMLCVLEAIECTECGEVFDERWQAAVENTTRLLEGTNDAWDEPDD